MQSEYAQSYRELYERHWWWRARERRIVETLAQYRPPTGWARILDIGCGDGLFFDRLLEFGQSVDGIEPDGEIVDPDGPHAHRIAISPFDASFQPGKLYSLVLMLDVLEHLQEPVAALRHAANLLEPGGLIVATVPAFMSLWTNHDVLNQHLTRYTRQRIQVLARDAGLQVDSVRYFFHWTCAGKLMVRALEAALHPRPVPPRVPNGWLNRFLYAACVAEQELLGEFHIPFGSSILFVARSESTGLQPR